MPKKVVIALGGNALQPTNGVGAFEKQQEGAVRAAEKIFEFVKDKDCRLVITHGNGPQIGNLLIQQAKGRETVPALPMFVCDAMTQGQIGYMLQVTLDNLCASSGIEREVAAIVTCVQVDESDKAFQNPSKPVGPFYSEKEAEKLAKENEYVFKEDAGRGWRRVVASPEPQNIVEFEAIKKMFESEIVVIAGGGGGVPVVATPEGMRGVDAVIDKDKTSSLLAGELGADLFIILTAVESVMLNFGRPDAKPISKMSLSEVRQFLSEGHFAEGSMKPKIEAAIKFLEKRPDGKVLITHHDCLSEAMERKSGTWITSN